MPTLVALLASALILTACAAPGYEPPEWARSTTTHTTKFLPGGQIQHCWTHCTGSYCTEQCL